MSQSLSCPHCGKNYVISERYSGAAVKCQFCGEKFRVPEEELIPDAVPANFADLNSVERGIQERGSGGRYDRNEEFPLRRPGIEPSRTVAGILAILFGLCGVHHFYTGQTNKGVHCLIWPFFTCGLALLAFAVIGVVDGVRYLTMTDEEWSHRWQNYAL